MTAEERAMAAEHFPVWLAATYPGETDVDVEAKRAEYEAELRMLLDEQ